MNAEEFGEKIKAAYDEKRRKMGTRKTPVHANRASSLGHSCARYLAYCRTNWADAADKGEQFGFSVCEGIEAERAFVAELAELGFEVIEAQEAFFWPEYNIAGHIEGRLRARDGSTILYEFKALNSWTAGKIERLSDLASVWWARRYIVQLGLYMLLKEVEEALLIVKDRQWGRLSIIPVYLWGNSEDSILLRKLTDEALDRAKAVNRSVSERGEAGSAWEPPARIPYDGEICTKCEFRHICLPAEHFGEGIKTQEMPEDLRSTMNEYADTKQASIVHDRASRALKKRLEGLPAGQFLLGEWIVERIERERAGKPYIETRFRTARSVPG